MDIVRNKTLDLEIVENHCVEMLAHLARKYGDSVVDPHLVYALLLTVEGIVEGTSALVREETDSQKEYFSAVISKLGDVRELMQPGGFPDKEETDK